MARSPAARSTPPAPAVSVPISVAICLALALPGCWEPAPEPAPTPVADARRTCPEGLRPAPESDTRPLPHPPGLRHGVLPSGLPYFVWSHAKPRGRAALRLLVKAGSARERGDERGFAHFVEHLAFTGTRLLSEEQVTELRRQAGRAGSDFNAYTDRESTRYHLQVPTDDPALLAKALLLLQQVSSDVPFDPATVDRVRPAIIEEARGGRDASYRLMNRLEAETFRGSPYALPTIGDMKIVQHATPERLRAFYRRWYRPDLMAVVAVGDFDADEVEAEIKRLWGGQPVLPTAALAPPPVPDHPDTKVALVPDRQQTTTTVRLSYRPPFEPRCADRCMYRRQQQRIAMLTLLTKRLEALKFTAAAPFSEVTPTYGQRLAGSDELAVQLEVDEEGALPALETLAREIDRIAQHGFTPAELEHLGLATVTLHEQQTIGPSWTSDLLATQVTRHALHGLPLIDAATDANIVRELLPTLSLCDLQAALRGLAAPANRLVLISGPPWAGLPSEAEVRAALARKPAQPLADYVPPSYDHRPLLSRPPAGGRVVQERQLTELDLFEWRLSNGVRVLIKRTSSDSSMVHMIGLSPGGHSLVADADHAAALLTADVLSASGFGDRDAGEMRRILRDRRSFRFILNERDEGFSASAPAASLDSLLQITYLALTQARGDAPALERRKQVARANLRRGDFDPDRFLADRWGEFYYRDHVRRRRPTIAEIDRISLDQVARVHRQRFGILDGLVVAIAGPVNVSHLQGAVETYLGGLPTARTESTRDVGARPLLGTHQVQLRRGEEPKATVVLDFTALAPGGPERAPLLGAVADRLRERLLQRLRVALGGTYDAVVETFVDPAPFTSQRLRVRFTCAPENVDRLIAAVKDEAERARRSGFSGREIDQLRTQTLRRRTERETNSELWAGQVLVHATRGWDLSRLANPELAGALLDSARLLQAARTHLDPRNLIVTVMSPDPPPGRILPASAARRTIR